MCADEMKNFLEHITKMKPKYEMSEGQIDSNVENSEAPKRTRSKKNSLK